VEKQTAGIGKGTPGPGRKRGVPNKATTEFRDTIRKLLEDNSANVGVWLKLVAEGDKKLEMKADPGKALDLMARLAEFAAPKLGRVELTGEGGGPVRFTKIEREIVDPAA
jgi:hypothetical protein